MKGVVCQSVCVHWETFDCGWILCLTVLMKKLCAEVVEQQPDVVSVVMLMCLSSSFIAAAIPGSSVAVVGVPFSERMFQFPVECREQFHQFAPLPLAGSSRGWLVQHIGHWSAVMIQSPFGWVFSDMGSGCIACLTQVCHS